jgi:hypothetical protein
MEEVVHGLMNLTTGALTWGIDHALALAVGALLGSHLCTAALGLVGDMLGRAKGLVDGVTKTVAGKQ